MRCENINACFEQISAYFNGKPTGHFLIVNTENYDLHQEILQRLEADTSKECVYVSANSLPNGLPDVDSAITKAARNGNFALIGLAPAQMIRGDVALDEKLDEVISYSVSGYGIVLLDHCEQVLQKFIRRDIRVKNRVVLVDGERSALPQIKFAKSIDDCFGYHPLSDFSSLLAYLEKLTNAKKERHSTITVLSQLPMDMFRSSIYSITATDGIYEALAKEHADIAGATEKMYGTDAQWSWLATQIVNAKSLSALVCKFFGSTVNLSTHISEAWEDRNDNIRWLLWLAMKAFGESNNHYLTYVLKHCTNVESFPEHIYLDFADVGIEDIEFNRYYSERKRLVEQLPENLPLVKKYCDKLGRHQKDEVFYLTDGSAQEKYNFVRCLSIYDFSNAEVIHATHSMSELLYLYMQDFLFDTSNTKLPEADSGFRDELTEYFSEYKMQKLTNRISEEFLKKVEKYSISPRPYNKLQPRSSIISHMDKKNTQLFFFDALGVEYLSFILAKCEEYGLVSEVLIGHCELPSITVKNKEFLQYFPDENWRKIDDLDEVKHHSQIYDYQKCEYPTHIFEELDIIDEQLRMIQSMLVQGTVEKALIVADHGASRLAVRYGRETSETIELDESGQHSGRCCPLEADPKLPYAAYEDGFAVLANYERFKGGRRANVEVHGGASLEEVVVPVITLMRRPENIELCFVNPVIALKPRITPELILYSNIPFSKPRLCIDGDFYEGEFLSDKQHARFEIPKIKRKGTYSADIYDGNKKVSISLEFRAQKQTREVDLL